MKGIKNLIIQLIKFGFVGIISTVVDFAVLIILKEIFNINVILAAGISFSVSVCVNYILSMKYVFKGKDIEKWKEFIIFVVLSIIGLGVNELVMWLGESINIYYILTKILATAVVMIYNFVSRKIFLEKH